LRIPFQQKRETALSEYPSQGRLRIDLFRYQIGI